MKSFGMAISLAFTIMIGSSIFAPNQVLASEKLVVSAIEGSSILIRIGKEVMTSAYGRIGKQIEFLDLPGKRAVVMANKGGSDAELIRSIRASKVYPNLIRIPVLVVSDEMAAYSINNNKKISSPKDLAPFVTGFRRGSTIPTKMTKGMNFIEFDSLKQGIDMLKRKRIDIMLYFKTSLDSVVNGNNFDSQIHQISDKLRVIKLYHYVHKRNKHLVPSLEKALKEMTKSGEKQSIIDRIIARGAQNS